MSRRIFVQENLGHARRIERSWDPRNMALLKEYGASEFQNYKHFTPTE